MVLGCGKWQSFLLLALKVICANSPPRLRASLIKNTVAGGNHTEVENRIIILKKAKNLRSVGKVKD